MKTIDDLISKIDELENLIKNFQKIDFNSLNIKNVGNVVVDNNNNPLRVFYAKNAKTINNKTYDEFVNDIKDYLSPIIDDLKSEILKQNKNAELYSSYKKDWSKLNLDNTKNVEIISLGTLDFEPSYLEIFVKLNSCSDKNGGSNGIITQIPPIGISLDGLPFSNDISKLENYSGWWIEDGNIKVFLKKADFIQWIGSCKDIQYKILAWR